MATKETQEVATPQVQQTQVAASSWPIAAAIFVGLLVIALVLLWGLSPRTATSPKTTEDIVIDVVMPEAEAVQPAPTETTTTGNYGYRGPWIEAGGAGIILPSGSVVEGPAVVQLEGRKALLIRNGHSYTMSSRAATWGLDPSMEDEQYMLGESPSWDVLTFFPQ